MDSDFIVEDEDSWNDTSSQRYILLSDTTMICAPQHLLQLMKHYDISRLTQEHMLFLCVYVMTLEEGYIPNELLAQHPEEFLTVSPAAAFNKENVRHCCAYKPSYNCDEPNATYFQQDFKLNVRGSSELSDEVGVSLTALVTGEFLIITLRPDEAEMEGKSVCLSISRYVVSKPQSNKPIQQCLRKMARLRMLLREELFVPIRNAQCELVAAAPYPGIMGLPQELRFEIYKRLEEVDLQHMSIVCKEIKAEVSKQNKILELKKSKIQHNENLI